MTKNILIIGGTFEGNQLAKIFEQKKFDFIISFSGELKKLNVNVSYFRKGRFGGIPKMTEWLKKNKITHVIDSSHPFAEKIS